VTHAAWSVVALPFAAAVAGLLLGRRFPPSARLVAVLPTAAATVIAVLVALAAPRGHAAPDEVATKLTPIGSIDIIVGTRVDTLAAVVAVMVCVVALLVQVYSTAYMREDIRYASYAALVSLFTAAMLLVVYSADLIVLLVGWEVMGICSYFLIGHHWELEDAQRASVKAFLMTKAGDVPFLFGIFTLGLGADSFRIGDVLDAVAAGDVPHLTVATLLLLGGVVGKSAQFPLHSWLPDAMAGPTPISALIHAATMVAAGIYVVARLYPAFLASPDTLAVLAVIAAVTMLGSALAALAQDDIKRVLAYSTVSQLAYMAGGLAVGEALAGRDPAIFHLLTHASFKALLFLCAGAVIHSVGSTSLREMGGLRPTVPVTFWTMTIGLAALAGLPPFAGFFSKEAILGAAEDAALHGDRPWVGGLVLAAGLLTVLVTAAYVTRLWLMTFFGAPRTDWIAHDPPAPMRWPLVALAVPAAVLGFAGLPYDDLTPAVLPSILGVLVALAGAGAAYQVWSRQPDADPALALGRVGAMFERAFYVDDVYDRALVRPVRGLVRAVRYVDDEVVDGYVRGSGTTARLLGAGLRYSQNGNVQTYLTGLLAGTVLIAVTVALAVAS
jgi:NADH-quinone oxidoreductase subunit L